MKRKNEQAQKPRHKPIQSALFWILATYSTIVTAAGYAVFAGGVTISYTPQQVSYQEVDMVDQFVAARAAEVEIAR